MFGITYVSYTINTFLIDKYFYLSYLHAILNNNIKYSTGYS